MTVGGGHERWKEQLPAYLLGSLDPGERADLQHHLDGCAECRSELEWLTPATGVLAADVDQVEPSPGLRDRVMAAVDADLAADPDPSQLQKPVRSSEQLTSSRAPRRSGRSSWLAGLLRPAVLGAAATALVFGIALGVVLGGGGSSPRPEQQVVTGQSTIGADAVMVASGGTGTLKMSGLKIPDEGQVYQAWIQRGQNVEPTDSLFIPRRDGTATASIPDLNGVSAVMVSTEPAGGSPQPTTAPVITVSMPG